MAEVGRPHKYLDERDLETFLDEHHPEAYEEWEYEASHLQNYGLWEWVNDEAEPEVWEEFVKWWKAKNPSLST